MRLLIDEGVQLSPALVVGHNYPPAIDLLPLDENDLGTGRERLAVHVLSLPFVDSVHKRSMG